MKNQIKKFVLPIGMGLVLLSITIMGLVSTTFLGCAKKTCPSGECLGTDNTCYSCSSGTTCTSSPSGNCSAKNSGGIACCAGSSSGSSGGGCGTQMGCCPPTGCTPPNSWYGSSTVLCYATSNDCHTAGNTNCRQCY